MKIKICYDNKHEWLEVDRDEMWLSLSLGSAEGLTSSEMEKRIQEKFDALFNRPEYNNWHRYDRHNNGMLTPDATGLLPDTSDEERRDTQYEYDALCQTIRQYLKPDQAELLIQIHINKVPKQEYAAQLGITPSAVSHRLETAEKNFKKFFPTPSSFILSRGL